MINMFINRRKFLSSLRVKTVAVVRGTDTSARAEVGFEQAFLEGVGLTTMDLDKHLRCLSRNPTLKFEAISSSFSSSQIIRDTTWTTHDFGLPLEDGDDEDDEVDGEDKDEGGRVLTFQIGEAVGFFLFLVRGWTTKLEDRRLSVRACLNVPS